MMFTVIGLVPDLSFLDAPDSEPPLVGLLLDGRTSLLVLVTIAVGVAAAAVNSLLQRDRARHGPALRRLAIQAGLDAAHRRVVARLAHRAGFRCPAALLLSRGCFDAAIAKAGAGAEDARMLASVRRAVFL